MSKELTFDIDIDSILAASGEWMLSMKIIIPTKNSKALILCVFDTVFTPPLCEEFVFQINCSLLVFFLFEGGCFVEIRTDSNFFIDCTRHLPLWRQRGFTKANGKTLLLNQEELIYLDNALLTISAGRFVSF